MSWALLAVCSIAFVELFLRLGTFRRVQLMNGLARKAKWVVLSPKISDHWKEKVLPAYSLRLMGNSLMMFATLVGAVSPFLLSSLIGDPMGLGFTALVASWLGILVSCLVAMAYVVVRGRLVRA